MSDKKAKLLNEENLSKVTGGYADDNNEIYRYLILKGIAPRDPSVGKEKYITNVIKENFPNSSFIIGESSEMPNRYTFTYLDLETEKMHRQVLSKDEVLQMLISKFGPL